MQKLNSLNWTVLYIDLFSWIIFDFIFLCNLQFDKVGATGAGCVTFPSIMFAPGGPASQDVIGVPQAPVDPAAISNLAPSTFDIPNISSWDQYYETTQVSYDSRLSAFGIMLGIMVYFKCCTWFTLKYVKWINR